MKDLQSILSRTRRLCFFGGAGVSTASGIPDFRSADGLYGGEFEGESPESILSLESFVLQTERFFRFYRRYMVHPSARPNAAHLKLYELEKADILRGVVTQNIDGLHKKAGSRRVYELHGSVYENACMECGRRFPLSAVTETDGIPRCPCGGVIKPEVVMYGEPLDKYVVMGALREISGADTLIVAGTSLQVEPAASMIDRFDGKELVVINRDPIPAEEKATLVIHGDVSEVMGALRVP